MVIDNPQARSRRSVLAAVVGGFAAALGASLGRVQPVAAANGDFVKLGVNNTATTTTEITYTNVQDAVRVHNAYGYAVSGLSANGSGVRGTSNASGGVGVQGNNSSTGSGVAGGSNNGTGVNGYSTYGTGVLGASTYATAVHGQSENAYGVYGESPTNYAVVGQSGSSGGVVGFSDTGFGVLGSSASAVGVQGQGGSGRGGRFSGQKAQIRLDPSTAATHPASGLAGDLFVDKSKRLWFCKGGTSWVRLDD